MKNMTKEKVTRNQQVSEQRKESKSAFGELNNDQIQLRMEEKNQGVKKQ